MCDNRSNYYDPANSVARPSTVITQNNSFEAEKALGLVAVGFM